MCKGKWPPLSLMSANRGLRIHKGAFAELSPLGHGYFVITLDFSAHRSKVGVAGRVQHKVGSGLGLAWFRVGLGLIGWV